MLSTGIFCDKCPLWPFLLKAEQESVQWDPNPQISNTKFQIGTIIKDHFLHGVMGKKGNFDTPE